MRLVPLLVAIAACGGSAPKNVLHNAPPRLKSRVAIAVVMQGSEVWIGNNSEVPEVTEMDPSMYPGALITLRKEIAKLELTRRADVHGALITYGDDVNVRVPLGPIAKLDEKAFGIQRDYYGTTGSELVSGVRAAAKELRKSNMSRRVLIVFGDGRDTDMDASRSQLARLKKQAEQDHIEVHAVVYKSKLSGEGTVVQHLTDRVVTVARRGDLPAAVKPLLDGLHN